MGGTVIRGGTLTRFWKLFRSGTVIMGDTLIISFRKFGRLVLLLRGYYY